MAMDYQIKLLLVEDAATMRKMEVKILRQLGFETILEAVDGNDACEKLGAAPDIRLVISDWSMPGKDGYELLQWMRGQDTFRTVPFIMATGQGDKQHVAQAMEGGASAVVAKPFSPDELKHRIEEIFGVRPAAADLPKEKIVTHTRDGLALLKVAHIQITDHLTLGILKNQMETGQVTPRYFGLETRCMANWNLLQNALEKGEVDAAFILAPAAMDLYAYKTPIRLVLFAHRGGSIGVRNKAGEYRKPYQQFFKHKTFYIPYKMSIHNMLAHKYFSEMGLKPGVAGREAVNVLFDVVAPINMPEFLAENPNSSGFMVAEPIGSRAIAAGIAERQFISGEIWENHPCCVVVFRDDFIGRNTGAVHEFCQLLVEAGQTIQENPAVAADIATSFLDPQKKIGLNPALLTQVLTEPKGIRADDLYPSREDLDIIQRYMSEKMNIGTIIDLDKFVDTRFADSISGMRPAKAAASAGLGAITVDTASGSPDAKKSKSHQLLSEISSKAHREGKYLIFTLAEERYGIPVLDVKEIVQMRAINSLPQMPVYFKGIINLRNKVIPVMDLRLKFGMPSIEYTERMCIAVLEIAGVSGSALLGLVVDSVTEVADIREELIQDTPYFGRKLDTAFILGLARTPGGITILVDIEKALAMQEFGLLQQVAGFAAGRPA